MSFPIKQFIQEANAQGKSKHFIEECVSYIKKLDANGFPVIFSLVHLAILIKIQSNYLRYLIDENEKTFNLFEEAKNARYKKFSIKKKKGGYREIMAPTNDLKYIQKWILVNILSNYKLRDSCTGFRNGLSILHNAKPHENAELILKVDLLKFYDTITERRVYGVFKSIGYAKNLSVSLAKLVTNKHEVGFWSSMHEDEKPYFKNNLEHNPSVLPQGSPCSPVLANIVATKMDIGFEGLGKKMNFTYTRYADDLCFSIKGSGKLPTLKVIKEIIESEGFFLNERKISYMGVGSKQYVTGLTVANGVNVSKKWRRELAKHIYFCRKNGVEAHLEYRKKIKNEFKNYSVLNFHDWLYGHICFVNSINKSCSKKLLNDFKKIIWSFGN